MIFNAVVKGGSDVSPPFAFTYSGSFTDNRDINGIGTVRLKTSGVLTVLNGSASVTVSAYILAGGGGGAASYYGSDKSYKASASGGGGGNQTVIVTLEPGTYEIVIGTGGAKSVSKVSAPTNPNTSTAGGDTTAFGFTSTGGGAATSQYHGGSGGVGGIPNGKAGTTTSSTSTAAGGSPNGGKAGNATASDGGDGYVELTFS